ncbi:DEKNAAC100602 [Brettanomyces naardenensis]|uniref:DEKNAAC100602 n=1 Tax=Brettanomyces naardenensis TaxID=13370 RepID=A0A448YFW1_BRENA|nr:DEKNAAC100602 [Brettanomyces naardenensis]
MSANDQLLQHLLNTLSADNSLRSNSESFLNELIDRHPESLNNLLELSTDTSIPFQIRLVAATFAKNKVKGSWFISETTNKYLKSQEIPTAVKNDIKDKLIGTLLKVSPFEHQSLFRQILNCIEVVLRLDPSWDSRLYEISQNLLQSNSNDVAKLYVSLSLVYQIAKKHCFDGDRSLIESIAEKQFPIYEQMFSGNFSGINDPSTASVFYLILKIYKFCTFVQLPKYLTGDLNNLQDWCNYQLEIIKIEPTFTNAGDDEEEDGPSARDHMLKKCQKWSFANLYRLKRRHAKENNKLLDPQLVNILLSQFIPNILTQYLSLTGHRFTDICHYYLVAFLTDCIPVDTVYEQYIKNNVEPILTSIIVPRLSCTDSKIETLEDDPIEYLRRYIDSASMSIDFKSAEVAANEFVFILCRLRFQDVGQDLLRVIHQIFQEKGSNLYRVEAGLKILNNSWTQMVSSNPEMDEAFQFFILPQLQDASHKWLQTVACETVAEINHQFKDMTLLHQVSSTVNGLITSSSNIVALEVESISALNALCVMPAIRQEASQNITKVMELLLRLNSQYELELTSDLMDDFVLKFSKELEPFAMELCKSLNDQFLQGAQELLTITANSHKDDYEKESQLSQLLGTITTMVVSMNSQKSTTSNMVRTFEPSVSFVLDNAMIAFITEAMDLLETTNFVLKGLTPETWQIYEIVLDSFENYGYEYFDNYGPYFQTVINYGFHDVGIDSDNHVQKLLYLLLNFYQNANDDEEMLEFVFDQTMLIVLNCNNIESIVEPLLKPIFRSLRSLSIDILRSYLRLFIALFLRRPDQIAQLTDNDAQLLSQFIQVWFGNAEELLTTVFDLKLEILSLITLLDSQLPQLDSLKETMLRKLMELIETLPSAIDKRVKLLKMENEGKLDESDFGDGGEAEIDIDDDEYAELNVDTPLDNVNVLEEFKKFVNKNELQIPQLKG